MRSALDGGVVLRAVLHRAGGQRALGHQLGGVQRRLLEAHLGQHALPLRQGQLAFLRRTRTVCG